MLIIGNSFKVEGDKAIFKLLEAMKHTLDLDDALYSISSSNKYVCECVQEVVKKDSLEELFD